MTLLGKDHFADFARKHPDARSALAALQREIEEATWTSPVELKSRYPKASFVGNDNVIFDIRGGNYRLHARVSFAMALVVVKRIGTHAEYDRWLF